MERCYPYFEVGEQLTLTSGGLTVHGQVLAIDRADDGSVRSVTLREPGDRSDPLYVAWSSVTLWRLGKPVTQQVPAGIAVPAAGLPPALRGLSHR
jgi:hypothetical protein